MNEFKSSCLLPLLSRLTGLPSALTEGNPYAKRYPLGLGLPSAFTQLLNGVSQQDLVLE